MFTVAESHDLSHPSGLMPKWISMHWQLISMGSSRGHS